MLANSGEIAKVGSLSRVTAAATSADVVARLAREWVGYRVGAEGAETGLRACLRLRRPMGPVDSSNVTFLLIASSWVELTVALSLGAWLGLPTLRIDGGGGNVVGGGTVAAAGNPGGTQMGGSTLRTAAGCGMAAGVGLRLVKSLDRTRSTVTSLSV